MYRNLIINTGIFVIIVVSIFMCNIRSNVGPVGYWYGILCKTGAIEPILSQLEMYTRILNCHAYMTVTLTAYKPDANIYMYLE